MQYRKMPGSRDALSILGYGCMRFPMADGKIDEDRAIAQIRMAIDGGVNYLDTAWSYHDGQSEPLLGRALGEGYRRKVNIATKLPTWLVESRKDMDRFLDAQLERLGVDHIDYYLIHALSGASWKAVEQLGVRDFLDTAQRDGRIVNPGFSFHGLYEDFRTIVDAYPWKFCQIQYNYLDTDFQAGTRGLEYAASKGLGVVVMEPLRGGNLGMTPPPAVAEIWDSAKTRRPPVEWALRWLWNHPEVTVVLSGMNEEEHIRQNTAIASEAAPDSLTEEELGLVQQAAGTFRKLMQVGCTGCGYCLPCPEGVQIPTCFDFFNKLYLFGDTEEAKYMYNSFAHANRHRRSGFASQCVACGQCLEKCPQGLNIPEALSRVAAEMGK
ncbi:aldo/keto reductase [Pseudodesulfovibrio cashew]|uniref:Aldo/keto reductase n=1 Tax=Pseudodesulfovibrio cashew TaxID=2678688 RepID=A0A6I6JRP1_9BACT|nr:aldo/keto reductase [Pseudodesulfovibrio cashew]QGY40274.1 aldo/keto reductase [Pseudodesulfovibrio cashew]